MSDIYEAMSYHESRQIQEATTMGAISFLPTQVGAVRSALLGLRKVKDKWGLEIQEGEGHKVVMVEDALQIQVPHEHWDTFQAMFEGGLENVSELALPTFLSDSIEEDEEDVLESRKDEIRSLVREKFETPVVKRALAITRKWIHDSKSKVVESSVGPVISLGAYSDAVEGFVDDLLEMYGEGRGDLEILGRQLREGRQPHTLLDNEYSTLAGVRMEGVYEGVGFALEVYVDLNENLKSSLWVADSEVVDQIEESFPGIGRVHNVLFPRPSHFFLNTGGLYSVLKEAVNQEEE